jgi:CBS domain-containing protein
MSVETFPRSAVVTVAPDASVASVAKRMDQEDIGFVVVSENENPVGTLSDRDIATRVAATSHDATDVTVEDVMTEEVVTANADADIDEVVRQLSDASVRRLVAVDDRGRVDGIVTLDDFVVLLARELDAVSSVVEQQTPGYDKGDEVLSDLDFDAEAESTDLALLGAGVSVVLALYEFYVHGNEKRGIFVGHWPPTILAFATYLRRRRE